MPDGLSEKRLSKRASLCLLNQLAAIFVAWGTSCLPSGTTLPDAAATPDGGLPPTDAGLGPSTSDGGAKEASLDVNAWTTYLALGSSSTVGAGASLPDETGYVPLLLGELRAFAPHLALVNRGQGGVRIGTYLSALDDIVAIKADVVTVLPLTDYVRTSVADFAAGYTTLLDALIGSGAEVWMGDLRIDPGLVCGVGSGPGGCYSEADLQMLWEKNELLAEMASTRPALHIVGVYDQNVAHPEYVASDGHPNDDGHRFLANVFWEAIARDAELHAP